MFRLPLVASPPPSSSDAPEVRRRLMPSISAHTSDRGGDIDVVPPAKRQRGNAQQNHGSTGDVFQAQGGGDVSFFPPCDGTMMAVREDGSSMTAATTSASMQAQQPTNPLAPASEPTASASWTAALELNQILLRSQTHFDATTQQQHFLARPKSSHLFTRGDVSRILDQYGRAYGNGTHTQLLRALLSTHAPTVVELALARHTVSEVPPCLYAWCTQLGQALENLEILEVWCYDHNGGTVSSSCHFYVPC